ncbi:MAG: hypothetical protein U5K28_05345 [Halobacteriales archaeon]|nr:hypothetical protein [Halobacteriales archaeon]
MAIATDEAAVFDAIADEMSALTRRRTDRPPAQTRLGSVAPLRERGSATEATSRRSRDCQFVLDTDRPWTEVSADLSQKKRRNLRKADESGVAATDVPVTADSIAVVR